jgi:bifunctional non-homologous end joining protein LigD
VTWEELEEFESAAQFTIFETPLLLDRGTSEALRGWGEADQALPRIDKGDGDSRLR